MKTLINALKSTRIPGVGVGIGRIVPNYFSRSIKILSRNSSQDRSSQRPLAAAGRIQPLWLREDPLCYIELDS